MRDTYLYLSYVVDANEKENLKERLLSFSNRKNSVDIGVNDMDNNKVKIYCKIIFEMPSLCCEAYSHIYLPTFIQKWIKESIINYRQNFDAVLFTTSLYFMVPKQFSVINNIMYIHDYFNYDIPYTPKEVKLTSNIILYENIKPRNIISRMKKI